MSLCILIGAHILVLRLCAKKKGTGVYMYVLSYSIEHVVVIKDCFVEFIYWWEFVCELSNPSPFGVCLVHFVREKTNDLFLRTLDYCLFYHFIHWWFDHSPCLDLSRSVLVWFLFDPLFFTLYFIHLVLIFFHSYPSTSCILYFYYIITIPLQPDVIFFFYFIINTFTLNILIPHWHIHVGRP